MRPFSSPLERHHFPPTSTLTASVLTWYLPMPISSNSALTARDLFSFALLSGSNPCTHAGTSASPASAAANSEGRWKLLLSDWERARLLDPGRTGVEGPAAAPASPPAAAGSGEVPSCAGSGERGSSSESLYLLERTRFEEKERLRVGVWYISSSLIEVGG